MKGNAVSQNTMNLLLGFFFFTSMFLLLLTGWRLRDGISREVEVQRSQAYYKEMSDQLLEASDYLTDEVRRFAVTGERAYMDDYWNELLTVKRREQAVEELERAGLSAEELELLHGAKNRSDYLSYVEIRAMRLVADAYGTDLSGAPQLLRDYVLNIEEKAMSGAEKLEEAQQLLFDDQYTFEKETINGKIERFQTVLAERLGQEVAQSRLRTDRMFDVEAGLIGTTAVLMFLAFVLFYRYVTRPVDRYAEAIRQGEELEPQGSAELRMFADAYNQTLRRMEEAAGAKSQFVARMSHEIRTPLTTIAGYQFLLEQTGLDEKQREYVANIGTAGRSLLAVVNQVLDFSKISQNKMELDETEFDLEGILKEVSSLFCYEAEKKGLYFRVGNEAGTPCPLRADAGKLRQILINVVGNAVKFTKEGGICVRAWIEEDGGGESAGTEKEESGTAIRWRLCVETTDTGCGIGAEGMERIFNPFEQSDGSVGREYGGTGLGLPISRDFARLMGGELEASSKPGEGSRFLLTLPVARVEAVPEKQPEEGIWVRYPGYKVLLAEDNQINQQMEAEILERFGFAVDTVSSGAEALFLAAEHTYDLVFLDLYLGDMTGLEVAETMRRGANRGAGYVVLTADVDVDHIAKIRAVLGNYLSKPLSLTGLQAFLKKSLGEGEPVMEPEVEMRAADRELLETVAQLRREFPARHEADLALLAEQVQTQDWIKVQKNCHMLKGVCLTLGYRELAQSLRELETEAKSAHPDGQAAREIVENLCAEYKKARCGSGTFMRPDMAGADAPFTQSEFTAFHTMLENGDFKSEEAFSRLALPLKKTLGDADYEELGHAMQAYDFARAAEILDRRRK